MAGEVARRSSGTVQSRGSRTIEGRVVPPRNSGYPRTNYIYVNQEPIGTSRGGGPVARQGDGGGSGLARLRNAADRTHNAVSQVPVPGGMPRMLGNRRVIFGAWLLTMVVIAFDEWHTNHIFPRPARFWLASGAFAGLAAIATVDVLVPVANVLAIGFLAAVTWELAGGYEATKTGLVKTAPGWFPGATSQSASTASGTAKTIAQGAKSVAQTAGISKPGRTGTATGVTITRQ